MIDMFATTLQRYAILLSFLRSLIVLAAVLCLFFGVGRFPDSPIHPCRKDGGYLYQDHPYGYCGKQGQSHTAADFAHFQEWEGIMFVLWPLMMLSMASLVRQSKKEKL